MLVELRAPAGGNLDRQPGGLQGVRQASVRRGVDGSRVLRRFLCIRQDLVTARQAVRQEFLDEAVVLGLVAGPAGQREVAHAVRAISDRRVDVFDSTFSGTFVASQ